MQDVETAKRMISEAKAAQDNATKIIMEAQKMKEKIAEQSGVQVTSSDEVTMIPLAMYEMQQDRNDAEKEKMRKTFRRAIIAISAALLAFIVGLFSTIIYFVSNYEVATYEQDGSGINNLIGNYSHQGNVTYESENSNSSTKE